MTLAIGAQISRAKFLTNARGIIWWPNFQLIQVAPPGGQLFNYRKWCHLVIKFSTNARIVKEVIIVEKVAIAKEVIIVTEVKMLKKLKTVKEVKVVSPVAMFFLFAFYLEN